MHELKKVHVSALSRVAVVTFSFLSLLVPCKEPAQSPRGEERNYDRRLSMPALALARAAPRPAQLDRLARLRDRLGGSLAHRLDSVSGVTRSLSNPTGYLTGSRSGDPADIALAFVRTNVELLGLDSSDVVELEVTDIVYSAPTGASHVYLRQMHLGLPIYNAQLQVHVNREGRVSSVSNAFVPGLASSTESPLPLIDAAQAVAASARHLNVRLRGAPRISVEPSGVRQSTIVSASAISSEPVEAELMWLPVGRELQLVWRFQIHTLDDEHLYDVTVDATSPGPAIDGARVFTRFDWVSSAQYRVYERPVESPSHTTPAPPSEAARSPSIPRIRRHPLWAGTIPEAPSSRS